MFLNGFNTNFDNFALFSFRYMVDFILKIRSKLATFRFFEPDSTGSPGTSWLGGFNPKTSGALCGVWGGDGKTPSNRLV